MVGVCRVCPEALSCRSMLRSKHFVTPSLNGIYSIYTSIAVRFEPPELEYLVTKKSDLTC